MIQIKSVYSKHCFENLIIYLSVLNFQKMFVYPRKHVFYTVLLLSWGVMWGRMPLTGFMTKTAETQKLQLFLREWMDLAENLHYYSTLLLLSNLILLGLHERLYFETSTDQSWINMDQSNRWRSFIIWKFTHLTMGRN